MELEFSYSGQNNFSLIAEHHYLVLHRDARDSYAPLLPWKIFVKNDLYNG